MKFTERVIMVSCDRCDTRVLETALPNGWLIANAALSDAPTATVEYHLCPTCREDLGEFMAKPPYDPYHGCEACRDGEHGSIEDGVCLCCRDLIDEAAYTAAREARDA